MGTFRRVGFIVGVAAVLAFGGAPSAQVPGLSGLLDRILNSRPSLTTSIDTATGMFPLLPDGFEPESFQPATWLARTPTGGFVLEPGAWEFQAESYCLKAGTPRPTRGDGFALAPLAGPRAAIIQHILQNAGRVPGATQEQIQVLLWAIIARSDIRELDTTLQRAASLLLTPREIGELSTDTLGRVAKQALQAGLDRLPPIAQQILNAEADVRDLAAKHASYAEIAAAAVPEDADAGEALREIPRGRWIKQAGYFVRFLPDGYARTTVQLYMPAIDLSTTDVNQLRNAIAGPRAARIAASLDSHFMPAAFRATLAPPPAFALAAAQRGGATYEPGGGAAVPGSSGGQRLGVSSRPSPDWHPAPPPWGPGPKPPIIKVKPPTVKPPDDPAPPDCDPSPEDIAGAQNLWNDWADSMESQAHQYDDAGGCPPSYGAEEEAQFAFAREQIAKYGNSTNATERDFATCVRTNVVRYRANQQLMCDNINDYRQRMLDHAKQARDLAKNWGKDPKGSFCAAQQQVKDTAKDEQPGAYKQPTPLATCVPPQ